MTKWHDLLQRGLQGEALVGEWLKLRGFFVLPVSLIKNGGAPALEGHLKRVIASNHLVSGDGDTFWAEIKTYQKAAFYNKYQRYVHGVPIRLWEQYREGERLTGIRGYLFILQLDTRHILEGQLDDIEVGSQRTQPGEKYPPSGPQIFFDVRRFTWYNLDTLEGVLPEFPEDLPPRTLHPWDRGRSFPTHRQMPLMENSANNSPKPDPKTTSPVTDRKKTPENFVENPRGIHNGMPDPEQRPSAASKGPAR